MSTWKITRFETIYTSAEQESEVSEDLVVYGIGKLKITENRKAIEAPKGYTRPSCNQAR